jgi:hypothetical protein
MRIPKSQLTPGQFADSLASAETDGLHFLFDEWRLGLVDITSMSYVDTDVGILNRASDFAESQTWLNGLTPMDGTHVWVFKAEGEFQLGPWAPCSPPYSVACGAPFSEMTQVVYSNVEGFGPKYGTFISDSSAPTDPDMTQLGIVQSLPESVWRQYNRRGF